MSAQATGWVWQHSPYRGPQLLVHLAIADVVNDAHDNEFWMSTGKLAAKAKVSRSTVTNTLAGMCQSGLLVMLSSGAATRQPTRYRFQMTSAPGALVAVGNSENMAGERATTSAIDADSLARLARAIPIEITQETKAEVVHKPDPDCYQCHGTGIAYLPGAGRDGPCPCIIPYARTERDEQAS